MAKSKVYLIGAGPGRPDLITVRGLNILKQAEVVIYDYLIDRKLLEVCKGIELICADTLGKKRYADAFGASQERINRLIIKKALQGKKVVRLKNGDPSVFGRLSQELEVLAKKGIEFEIVPGVTAASAAAAYAGIPLTDRRFSSSVVYVTGHEDPKKKETLIDWKAVAPMGTIILYMAVENFPQIIERLLAYGKPANTPITVVSQAGDVSQKTVQGNLGNIIKEAKKSGITAPSIVIIGETVNLARKFNWLMKSKRILFTGVSSERFFTQGSYFHLPLIEIEPLENYREFDKHLKEIKKFDWIVFSSRYGVECFFRRLVAIGLDGRDLSGVKIAAIGNSTAQKLSAFGIRVDLVPQEESSVGLLETFRKVKLAGKKVFLPRSDIADKGLTEGFKKLGAEVTAAVAYRNVMPKNLPDLDLSFFDEIYFTSPSTARNFQERYGVPPSKIKIKWIGEVTKQELRRLGMI